MMSHTGQLSYDTLINVTWDHFYQNTWAKILMQPLSHNAILNVIEDHLTQGIDYKNIYMHG